MSTLARYLRASRSRGRTFQRKVEKACQTYLTEHLQMLHLAQQQRASEGLPLPRQRFVCMTLNADCICSQVTIQNSSHKSAILQAKGVATVLRQEEYVLMNQMEATALRSVSTPTFSESPQSYCLIKILSSYC